MQPVLDIVRRQSTFEEVLGGLNDAATLLRLLPEALAGARAPDARVAGMIAGYAGRQFGFSMSIFNMGGTLAFGIGPLIVRYPSIGTP